MLCANTRKFLLFGLEFEVYSDLNLTIFFILQELGNLEREEEWLKRRYELIDRKILFKLVFCINLDNIDFSWNDTD